MEPWLDEALALPARLDLLATLAARTRIAAIGWPLFVAVVLAPSSITP